MKTTKKDFGIFKDEFERLARKWELTDYELYFSHDKLDGCYAQIRIDTVGRIASVDFADEWEGRKVTPEEIRRCAKHECVHLLLGEMSELITASYLSKDEHHRACEMVTRKLCKLL